MKAVLISIQPKWCGLIASGKKTVEVRKTKPKLETPFKVYIYCTKNKDEKIDSWLNLYCDDRKVTTDIRLEEPCYQLNGKVIGEFVCDKVDYFSYSDSEWAYSVAPAGSIMPMHETTALRIMQEQGCLSLDDINAYFGDEDYKAYFWHISNLVIYDKPRELSEFKKHNRTCYYDHLGLAIPKCKECKGCQLTRPPQSWCYVESKE